MVPAGGIELYFIPQGESSPFGHDTSDFGRQIPQPGHPQSITTRNIVDVAPDGDISATEETTLRNRKITEQQQKINRSFSGISNTGDGATSSDLDELITAWPKLPTAIRAGILAMIKATSMTQA